MHYLKIYTVFQTFTVLLTTHSHPLEGHTSLHKAYLNSIYDFHLISVGPNALKILKNDFVTTNYVTSAFKQ